MKALLIALYLLSIVSANVVTASFAPLEIGILIIPMGSLLIGATFILRDFVQQAIGRKKTYAAIAAAMLLSLVTSYALGDTLWIVFASSITFLLSESTDTELFTRLKAPFSLRVLYSGIGGGFVDSVLFIVIGLSPLGAGFLPWAAVPFAILGQVLAKTVMQVAAAACVGAFMKTRPSVKA